MVRTEQRQKRLRTDGKNTPENCKKKVLKVKMKYLSHVWLFATPWTVQPTRLLRPWNFPGRSNGVGCHFLLQGIFLTQGSNLNLAGRQTFYLLSHQGSPDLHNHNGMVPHLESDILGCEVKWGLLQTKLVKVIEFLLKFQNIKDDTVKSAAHNMSANLKNSAVATGLEKVSFHSNLKKRQCQRKFKLLSSCTQLTY